LTPRPAADRYSLSFAVFGLLVFALALAGCNRPIVSHPVADAAADSLARLTSDPAGPDSTGTGGVRVYVDQSASIRPYLTGTSSVLTDLTSALDGTTGASFFGFGFPRQDGGQVIEPLAPSSVYDPARFVYVNNDYGHLFDAIARRPQGTHLVLSDGVQSDPNEGARYRPIVDAVDQWLARGGTFAVLTFRASYEGTYYSEVRSSRRQSPQVAYSCDDRPLHAFVFAPRTADLQQIVERLQAVGQQPDFQLVIGPEAAVLEPQSTVPSGQRGKTLYLAKLTNHEAETGKSIFSARPIHSGENKTLTQLPFVLTLDDEAEPWHALAPDQRATVLESARLTARVFDLGNVRRDSLRLRALDLNVTSEPVAADSTGRTHLLAAQLPEAEELQVTAWDVTARPSTRGAYALIPADLSTTDDSPAEACSRTLNFQYLLGALVEEHYVLGRALLLTEN
jgi:hypothetical protein